MNLPFRSCWKCNKCHDHLKKDFGFWCFVCEAHYKNGKKVYGGATKKIKKIIESDDKIKDILSRMNELRSEKW